MIQTQTADLCVCFSALVHKTTQTQKQDIFNSTRSPGFRWVSQRMLTMSGTIRLDSEACRRTFNQDNLITESAPAQFGFHCWHQGATSKSKADGEVRRWLVKTSSPAYAYHQPSARSRTRQDVQDREKSWQFSSWWSGIHTTLSGSSDSWHSSITFNQIQPVSVPAYLEVPGLFC